MFFPRLFIYEHFSCSKGFLGTGLPGPLLQDRSDRRARAEMRFESLRACATPGVVFSVDFYLLFPCKAVGMLARKLYFVMFGITKRPLKGIMFAYFSGLLKQILVLGCYELDRPGPVYSSGTCCPFGLGFLY